MLREKGGAYYEFRTAKKEHRCFGRGHSIAVGERHAVYVAMPGHDANTSPTPWRIRVCMAHCHEAGRA